MKKMTLFITILTIFLTEINVVNANCMSNYECTSQYSLCELQDDGCYHATDICHNGNQNTNKTFIKDNETVVYTVTSEKIKRDSSVVSLANGNDNDFSQSNQLQINNECVLIDQSITDLIEDILYYPRYLVPAIIIVLGTLDFAKAVVAGKEDEMKKAQSNFIKRLIMGIAVFFVPFLVKLIIGIGNSIWGIGCQ